MIEPLYAISGFAVGFLVGMTGVGGGSLMTPLLILLFGVHPATAVGTDLLYAAATKTGGTLFHGLARSIEWRVVGRLALGSLPATALTLLVLSNLDLEGAAARALITTVLCVALVLTAFVLIFRNVILRTYGTRLPELDARRTTKATIAVGAALGVLVAISSVGAGAIGVMALVLLYPKLPIARIVGSDIAHAVPLTLLAGVGHWMIGTVDWQIMGSLLVGSLPGIFLGSWLALRVPETALRLLLAGTLLVVSGKLALDQFSTAASVDTAHSKRTTPARAVTR
jgi:uncharacterized membrane protein YfcA